MLFAFLESSYWGYIGGPLGIYWDNGKENGNYYSPFVEQIPGYQVRGGFVALLDGCRMSKACTRGGFRSVRGRARGKLFSCLSKTL